MTIKNSKVKIQKSKGNLPATTFEFLLFTFYFLSPLFTCSQILNIDKTDTNAYSPKAGYNFNLSMGLEIDKQKTTLYDATNTAAFSMQKNKELLIVAGSYRFTYNGPEDILNAGYIHLRLRHHYRDKFQPEPFFQYQWDNKRGMEMRVLGGANVRYNFFKGDKFDCNAGLGLFYEAERWDYVGVDSVKVPPNPEPVESNLWKVNSYFRFDWKLSGNSDIVFNVFFQTRPDHFEPRIAPHLQWTINAGKHFGFAVIYGALYDSHPVVPIPKFYYTLSNSITANF
jgi:hypothetical protein